jgi:hypothetical protein
MAGALDERGRLIDRICEQHLLTSCVVKETATTITDKVAYDECYLDRVASKPRLVATHDHVTAPCLGEQFT